VNITDLTLINTSMCLGITNSTGIPDCGIYRINTIKYYLKGKMVPHHPIAWTKFTSLAVTIHFQGAIVAQVYLDKRNFVRRRVSIL
jgi:hypothetical protein